MAIEDFIPELWAAALIRHLDPLLVYASPDIANRNYEGEIKQAGDTVHLQNVDDVEVGTYKPSEDIVDQEADTDIDTTLEIDQFKYWSVKVDDVHKVQSHVNLMDEKTKRAAVAIGKVVDSFVASFQADVVAAGNVLEAAEEKAIKVENPEEAYEYLVDLQVQLDEQDVPEVGRYVVIPPWYHGLLEKDDRFVGAGTSSTDSTLRNGKVGEAAGFSVRKSNRVPNTAGADFRLLGGTKAGITYAEQFVETEALRMEKRFKTKVRGLYLFGATVPNPDELAVLRVSKGA